MMTFVLDFHFLLLILFFFFFFILTSFPPFSSFSSPSFTSPAMNVCSTVYDKTGAVYLIKNQFVLYCRRIIREVGKDQNPLMTTRKWERKFEKSMKVSENGKNNRRHYHFQAIFELWKPRKWKFRGSIMNKCCNDLAECFTPINYNLLI